MRFPNARDIATKNVVFVTIDTPLHQAIDKMIANEHRDIVVVDGTKFYILRAIDVISLKEKNIPLDTSLQELKLLKIPSISKHMNVLHMLHYIEEKEEYLCVVNEDGSLYGLITHTDITTNIDPDVLMNNYKIEDFLKLIRRAKWVKKGVPTKYLLEDMAKNTLDCIIVIEDLIPVGILTTKDVVLLIKEDADLEQPIEKYMNSPVDTVGKSISIAEALEYIKTKHYKRVVVVDEEGLLVGVVSQKELISLTYSNWALMMREHEQELKEINAMLTKKNKQYELLASTDPLTGLYNRYKFEQLYDSSLRLSQQRGTFMSLILLDLDHFKSINDTYGHNVGDEVLQTIGEILKNKMRETDIVCRWGGEEFAILVPAIDIDKGVVIAEKLRKKIEKTKIDKVGKITASFGVTQIKDELLEEAIEMADKALYEAKRSGRNKVVKYENNRL